MVTHDLNPVMRITDYVLLLNKRVLALGKPDAVVSRESMSDLFGGEVEIVRMGEICYIIGGDVHGGSGARR
jgi:zinc/manganese transport system ATP-binding protein